MKSTILYNYVIRTDLYFKLFYIDELIDTYYHG